MVVNRLYFLKRREDLIHNSPKKSPMYSKLCTKGTSHKDTGISWSCI